MFVNLVQCDSIRRMENKKHSHKSHKRRWPCTTFEMCGKQYSRRMPKTATRTYTVTAQMPKSNQMPSQRQFVTSNVRCHFGGKAFCRNKGVYYIPSVYPNVIFFCFFFLVATQSNRPNVNSILKVRKKRCSSRNNGQFNRIIKFGCDEKKKKIAKLR